jgi:hypothetical protein
MNATPNIRLPGVYFLPPPRAVGLGLPPLDVAAFVGFAERGPLHMPIPVEDLNVYRAVFGEDLPLAREQGGRTIYANLPTAVAAFFANGGRRCYVVRVAGKNATRSRFRVPGMVALGEQGEVKLTAIWASSEGRWSERLRLGARLRITPLPTAAFQVIDLQRLEWMTGSAPQAIREGDLLRLTFDDGQQWLFPVTDVERPPNATPETPLILMARHTWQLTSTAEASPPLIVQQVRRLTLDGTESLNIGGALSAEDGMLALQLVGSSVDQVQRGDVLRLELSDGSTYLFPVMALRPTGEIASPPTAQAVALAEFMLRLPAHSLPIASPPPLFYRVDRLRFDLLLREGKQRRPTLNELAFNMGHSRFWGEVALLESSVLYRQSSADADSARAAHTARLFREMRQDKRSEEAQNGSLDAVALAGLLAPLEEKELAPLEEEEKARTYLPLGMASVLTEDDLMGPVKDDIGNDDLGKFQASLFLDDYLVPAPKVQSTSGSALMAEAFNRFYVQDKRLRGLHSLLFMDEVALVSVPEAVHREWEHLPVVRTTSEASPPSGPPPPDWSQFLDCEQPPTVGPPPQPVEPPRPTGPRLPVLKSLDEFSSDPLLEIQHALVNFCQARHDVVNILTLPLHFEKRQCIGWQEDLRQRLGLPRRRSVFNDVRAIADLSYVAVYHPWLLVADANAPDRLRAVPCDGAVCGMIAAREREQQVWVAPANVPLQGVLGLTPPFSKDDWADLFDLQFNLVRPEPRDFRVMSAQAVFLRCCT